MLLAIFDLIFVFDNIVRLPCAAYRRANARRRYIAGVVTAMATPPDDDARLHGDVCSICYGDLPSRRTCVTSCDHVFHHGCLTRWLQAQSFCPLCHVELRVKNGEGELAGSKSFAELYLLKISKFTGKHWRVVIGPNNAVDFQEIDNEAGEAPAPVIQFIRTA